MDFIGNIGQNYLERKANQVPYLLEAAATKQIKTALDPQQDGAKKAYRAPAAETVADSEDTRSAAPSRKHQPSEKDEEIGRLRRQLAEANTSKDREHSVSAKSESNKSVVSSRPKKSHSSILGDIDEGAEKGQFVSNARQKARDQYTETRSSKQATGLNDLGGRIEHGQMSTKSRQQHREGHGRFEAEKSAKSLVALQPGNRRTQPRPSQSKTKSESSTREKHGSSSVGGSRLASEAAFESYSSSEAGESQRLSRTRSLGHGSISARSRKGPNSESGMTNVSRAVTERHGPEAGDYYENHDSRPKQDRKSLHDLSNSRRSTQSEVGQSRRASSTSGVSPMGRLPLTTELLQAKLGSSEVSAGRRSSNPGKEHGGSAALLHAREARRKSRALTGSTIEEQVPIERRPEVSGHGFRPRRASGVDQRVGIVEVEEDVPSKRRAPHVQERGSKTIRAKGFPHDQGDHVIKIGRRGEQTLYKVR